MSAAGRPLDAEGAAAPARPLRFSAVSKVFTAAREGRVVAVDAIDLDIQAGQFVAIIGPSGCGKSTLLRLADGLVEPDQGTVLVGDSPPRPGPGTGLVFQNFRLIPWRTVAENVGFGLEAAGVGGAARAARIQHQLERVGLARWAAHYPAQLSGGMRQRVALARALAGEPDVLLMDEPFANLDAQTRELMQEDLLALCRTRPLTVLFVTHSVDEALLLADRVVVMGAGRILDDVMVDLPRPRAMAEIGGASEHARLRAHLWEQIRRLVLADPASAFFGRQGMPE